MGGAADWPPTVSPRSALLSSAAWTSWLLRLTLLLRVLVPLRLHDGVGVSGHAHPLRAADRVAAEPGARVLLDRDGAAHAAVRALLPPGTRGDARAGVALAVYVVLWIATDRLARMLGPSAQRVATCSRWPPRTWSASVLFAAVYATAGARLMPQAAFLACLLVIFGLVTDAVGPRREPAPDARSSPAARPRRGGARRSSSSCVPTFVLMPVFWLDTQLPPEADFTRYLAPLMTLVLISLALVVVVNVVGAIVAVGRAAFSRWQSRRPS